MNKAKRSRGKLVRKLIRNIAKLDRAWRLEGKQEGRLANKLAFELGNAYRAGMGAKARQAQSASAARLGERSGWEKRT
jgi:hypothetical protein